MADDMNNDNEGAYKKPLEEIYPHSSKDESDSAIKPKKALAIKELDAAERENSTSSLDNLYNPKADSGSNGLYNPNSDEKKFSISNLKHFFWGSRKRKVVTTGTGVSGTIVGILISLLLFAAGPAQLIQLSQTLQKNFDGMDRESSSRLDVEMADGTSALTGAPADLGATRLGNLTQLILGQISNKLEAEGIEPIRNTTYGLKGWTIEPDKFAASHPELDVPSSLEGQKVWWTDQVSDIPNIQVSTQGKLITLIDPNQPFELLRATTRATDSMFSNLISDNFIEGAINGRVLNLYFDAPLLDPLKVVTSQARRAATISAEQQTQDAVNEQGPEVDALLVSADDNPGVIAALRGSLNSLNSSSIGKSLTVLLVGQAIYCEIYGQVNNIVGFNRDAIVLPAAVEAVRFVAIGEKIKAGDVSSQEVGNVFNSLTDSQGQSIWGAKALQVEENTPDPSGTDLPTDYYQAFSGATTANSIDNYLSLHGISSLACNPIVLGANALFSLIQLVTAPETGGATFYTYLASRSAEGLGFGLASYFVIHDVLTGLLTDKAMVPAVLNGPLGGNLMAFGARESSNIVARSEGGVELTNSQTNALTYQQEKQENKQFDSESMFARLFNIDDNRSLLGKLADSINPHLIDNISSFASDFFAMIGNIPKELLGLLPKVSADQTPYNWGFPQYGIPDDIINSSDPTMQNPYENASIVVNDILDNNSINQSYISRAVACFDDQIEQSSPGVWDVIPIPNSDVNPNSATYENSDCNATTDTNTSQGEPDWQRIILFVFDTRTIQAAACYEGVGNVCDEIGF
jgi:hypothetical protein